MARGKRTDAKSKAKIIEAKINSPDASTRDIEARTWLAHETVAKVLREDLAQVCTQSERIASLVDRNNKLQSSADAMIAEMIAEKNQSITVAQLTSLRDSTFKQNQLLKWDATERVEVSELDEERKAIIAKRYSNV